MFHSLCLLFGQADLVTGLEQYAMRAFADALEAIPIALAENSGLSPIEALAAVKSAQVKTGNPRLGVDCVQFGNNDMSVQKVHDVARISFYFIYYFFKC